MDIIDVGCGMNKTPGSYGIDIYPYAGVDRVVDLNSTPWSLEESKFDQAVARHVIEHVLDVAAFMKELHRILKPGAELYIETPHFSSINSWSDPTHRIHLSSKWYEVFLAGKYLSFQCGAFELIDSHVSFGKTVRSKIGQTL